MFGSEVGDLVLNTENQWMVLPPERCAAGHYLTGNCLVAAQPRKCQNRTCPGVATPVTASPTGHLWVLTSPQILTDPPASDRRRLVLESPYQQGSRSRDHRGRRHSAGSGGHICHKSLERKRHPDQCRSRYRHHPQARPEFERSLQKLADHVSARIKILIDRDERRDSD